MPNTFRLLEHMLAETIDCENLRLRPGVTSQPNDYLRRPVAIPCPWSNNGYEAMQSGLWYVVTGPFPAYGVNPNVGIEWRYQPTTTDPGDTITVRISGSSVDTITVDPGGGPRRGIWWLPDSYFASPWQPTISITSSTGLTTGVGIGVPAGFLCADTAPGDGWVDCVVPLRGVGQRMVPLASAAHFVGLQRDRMVGSTRRIYEVNAAYPGAPPHDWNDTAPSVCPTALTISADGTQIERTVIPAGAPVPPGGGGGGVIGDDNFIIHYGPWFPGWYPGWGVDVEPPKRWLLAPRTLFLSRPSWETGSVTVTVKNEAGEVLATVGGVSYSTPQSVSFDIPKAVNLGPVLATFEVEPNGSYPTVYALITRFHLPPPIPIPVWDGLSCVPGRRRVGWTLPLRSLTSLVHAPDGATSYAVTTNVWGRTIAAAPTEKTFPAVAFRGMTRGWYVGTGYASTILGEYGLSGVHGTAAAPYAGTGGDFVIRVSEWGSTGASGITRFTPAHQTLTQGVDLALTVAQGWRWAQFTAPAAGRYRLTLTSNLPACLRAWVSVSDPDVIAWEYSIGAQAPDYRWDFERPWNGTANSPPSGSWYGQRRYEIGDTPTGAWAGHAGDIAVGDGNGTSVKWTFYTPPDGAIYWDYGIVEAKDLTIELASGQTMWVRVGGWGNSEKLVTGAGAEDEPPWGVGQGKMTGRSITALVTAA